MGWYIEPLCRPYDVRGLLSVYVRTQRRDYAHEDFLNYYTGLLAALEKQFGLRLAREGLSFTQGVFWGLFRNTVNSLLCVGTPWDGYLEAGLLHRKLEEAGEAGEAVNAASRIIGEAAQTSTAAHWDMLHALFIAIFGKVERVVTSEELATAGFDDSKEPVISDYFDCL